MCGIAGIIHADQQFLFDALLKMGKAIEHRGPDASGETIDQFGRQTVGLGHRRLSILDLSMLGKQPMSTDDGLHRIVFNGEIYNFRKLRAELEAEGERFKSNSDTEVLLLGLSRFGIEFVRRLQGMYAFAYLNRVTHSLFLARDPAGIKPLFFHQSDQSLVFASELRALLVSGLSEGKLSRSAIANYFAYGAVAQPTSIFEGIQMMEPGSWREYRAFDTGFRLIRENVWWTPPTVDFNANTANAVSQTRTLLESAVKDHLIADVPVGVFLSAGIDSTILATLAKRSSNEVQAFTVSVADAKDMDETEIASATASRIGMKHVPVEITESDALEATTQWFASADQPSIDGLNSFVISKAIRGHGIKVALSGLGADELFGGYPSFQEIPRFVSMARQLSWVPTRLRRSLAKLVGIRSPRQISEKMQDMLSMEPSIGVMTTMRRRLMSNHELSMLGLDFESFGLSDCGLPTASMNWQPDEGASPGWAVSIAESRYYQGNMLLRDADVNSMAHSLELRVPFLDQRLLDWVHTLPDHVRFPSGSTRKHLLREAFKGELSEALLRRPKTGFSLPVGRWMLGKLRPKCEASIDHLAQSGFVDPKGAFKIWSDFVSLPDDRSWSRAFALVVLGDYLNKVQEI